MTNFIHLLEEVHRCTHCEPDLPYGARPVVQAHPNAKILIVGQAPGRRVHETGIPFNDPSGVRLREWMGIPAEVFYDQLHIALLPMGFCYPGTGKSGDLPPRPECSQKWRAKLLAYLSSIRLTLLVGQYAINEHLDRSKRKKTLTETVKCWKEYRGESKADLIPLPHPSPRNNIWLKRNEWFEEELVPYLRERIRACLNSD